MVRWVLSRLEEKGIDLASLTAQVLGLFRDWLQHQVITGVLSTSTAGHAVAQWNSVMRVVLDEKSPPGRGLILRGFPSRPRAAIRVTEDEFNALLAEIPLRRFRSELDRRSFQAFLGVEWSTGARIGSLRAVRVAEIKWQESTLHLRHMKNVVSHDAVSTDRAIVALHGHVDYLYDSKHWTGTEACVFMRDTEKPLTTQGVNRMLSDVAAFAGIRKNVTTHLFRKSVGTIMGRENPKLAREQLGITDRVFSRHYFWPTLDDRLPRRDILPGVHWRPTTAEGMAAQAALEYDRGKMTEEQFRHVIAATRTRKLTPGVAVPETSPYG
jgi:site-specific recombinase XerD